MRTLEGVLMGASAACVALAIGAANVALALLIGRRIRSDNVLVGVLLYIAGFIVAGAVFGLLSPMKGTWRGRYALGLITAASGLFVMLPGMIGPLASWDGGQWVVAVGCSVIYGVMIARHLAA